MMSHVGKIGLAVIIAVGIGINAYSQQKLVDEVKISANVLSPTIDTYKKALANLQPAFNHPETKEKVDTWVLAGNIAMSLYDKYNDNIAIGKKVDGNQRADALIKADEFYARALPLDTVFLKDKKGNLRINKKTGKPKFKAKNSKDIMKRVYAHAADYLYVGYGQLVDKKYDASYKLLTVYERLAKSPEAATHNFIVPDSVMGLMYYYKGIDLYYMERYDETAIATENAMQYGYESKGLIDLAIDCYKRMGQESKYIQVVSRAYQAYGKLDDAYSRILINHYISNKKYDEAQSYIDNSLAVEPDDDKLLNLKGLVVEKDKGLDSAFVYYEKAISINPANADAQFNVGRYYYNQAIEFKEDNTKMPSKKQKSKLTQLYKKALPHFEVAYKENLQDPALRDALMNIYYQLGDGKKLKEIESKH